MPAALSAMADRNTVIQASDHKLKHDELAQWWCKEGYGYSCIH